MSREKKPSNVTEIYNLLYEPSELKAQTEDSESKSAPVKIQPETSLQEFWTIRQALHWIQYRRYDVLGIRATQIDGVAPSSVRASVLEAFHFVEHESGKPHQVCSPEQAKHELSCQLTQQSQPQLVGLQTGGKNRAIVAPADRYGGRLSYGDNPMFVTAGDEVWKGLMVSREQVVKIWPDIESDWASLDPSQRAAVMQTRCKPNSKPHWIYSNFDEICPDGNLPTQTSFQERVNKRFKDGRSNKIGKHTCNECHSALSGKGSPPEG